MTSTPLTLIEGALALPRLRPLDHLPEPLGRDWALLPLGQHWRAGLDSLYGALLRTDCMQRQPSYGLRVSIDRLPIGVQRAAAQPVEAAPRPVVEPAKTVAAARPDAQRKVPQGPMRIALKRRSPRIAQRRAVWNRRTVAASAGAIGCVAVLAWWMVDQPLAPRHMASDMLNSVQALMARRDAPAEKRRSQYQIAGPEVPVIAEAATPAPALPPLPADVAAAAPAPIAALPQHSATLPEPAPSKAIHSYPSRRVLRAKTHRQPVDRSAANESSHEAHVPSVAVMRARSNASSAAANDASFVQARFGADEYAGVTTLAMMPLHDVAAPPRTALSNNLPTISTEWMNHMSQRRVTEIPEQFAR